MPLGEYRKGIDELDSKIIELLNARSELAAKIGAWKKDRDHPVYVPERESLLLRRLTEKNRGPLSDVALACIYREVISGAIALEHPLRIARLKTDDDFDHPAKSTFGASASYFEYETLEDAVGSVNDGDSDYAVVDIVGDCGCVNKTLLSLVAAGDISIVAEKVTIVMEKVAAITTRTTWILGDQRPEPSGHDRTALLLEMSNDSDTVEKNEAIKLELFRKISHMAEAGGDLLEIICKETLSDSVFLVLSGHQKDESFQEKLDALKGVLAPPRILASYPVLLF